MLSPAMPCQSTHQAKRKHARTRDDGMKLSSQLPLQLAEQAEHVCRLVDLVIGMRSFQGYFVPRITFD